MVYVTGQISLKMPCYSNAYTLLFIEAACAAVAAALHAVFSCLVRSALHLFPFIAGIWRVPSSRLFLAMRAITATQQWKADESISVVRGAVVRGAAPVSAPEAEKMNDEGAPSTKL